MVFIRTDANERVATGHVMRCITIAEKMKELDEKIIFLFRDTASVRVLNGRMKYEIINANEEDVFVEIEQMKKILQKEKNPILLLDSYEFGANYMEHFRGLARIITFDDMFAEKFPVDVVINYNLYYSDFDYEQRYQGTQTQLLLGGDYVPLREEFQKVLRKNPSEQVETVMLICGGGDQYHMLKELLKHFCKFELYKRYRIFVIAGVFNTDLDCLQQYAELSPNINIYVNVNNLATIMQETDIAISAASTVLYECCCVGVPTIFFSVAENQERDVNAFALDGTMRFAGDVRENKKQVIDNIFVQLEELAEDFKVRNQMVQKMRKKIDGRGAERIAKEIVKNQGASCIIQV